MRILLTGLLVAGVAGVVSQNVCPHMTAPSPDREINLEVHLKSGPAKTCCKDNQTLASQSTAIAEVLRNPSGIAIPGGRCNPFSTSANLSRQTNDFTYEDAKAA